MCRKLTSLTIILCFFLTTLGPYPQAHGSTGLTTGADSVSGLPVPGTMVNLSPAYQPVIIRGLTVHKDNPFLFDFIVDVGQDKMSGEPLKKEGEKLIKYFLASLAIPDKDVWVNLSPYEKNKMIPEALGQTEMGRDLLEQDYILKQITASLIYPEKQLGKTFWDKVYAKAQQMYGTTQVPVNTFSKVWIMADKAEVFEHNQTAFVVGSHLKVMLEEDYLAMRKHADVGVTEGGASPSRAQAFASTAGETRGQDPNINALGSQIVRQIILPALEKEINTGKNFANLRQIFNSIILSSWYKKNLKQALLNQVYADKNKIKGIQRAHQDLSPEQIYRQYLKAYKKGVFNYIKEDVVNGETIPRKYFSGGITNLQINPAITTDRAMLEKSVQGANLVDFATLASTAQPTNPNPAMVSLQNLLKSNPLQRTEALQEVLMNTPGRLHDLEEEARTELRSPDINNTDHQNKLLDILRDIRDMQMRTASNAAMVTEMQPYQDIDSMYRKLPNDIVKLMTDIAERNGFGDSFTSVDRENILKLMTKIGEIYARMKLTTENFHNHFHNMDIAYGSLILNANADLIRSKEDLISVFLAGLFHDFHMREVKPEGSKSATPAYVHETLGRPGTSEGGQLLDLLDINHFVYQRPAILNARYNETITTEDKVGIRKIVQTLTRGLDLQRIYAEMIAQIRRTDYPSDVTAASDVYKRMTQNIRDMMDREALAWTNGKEEDLDKLIQEVKVEYTKIYVDINEKLSATNGAKDIAIKWVNRQEEIDLYFLKSLEKVTLEHRAEVYQQANRDELADQSVMFWMGTGNVTDSITLGLREELPFANREGNKPMFLDYQLLIDRVLTRLRELPLNLRINFFKNVEYYVDVTKKFVDSLKKEVADQMPPPVLLRMQQDWIQWKLHDEERVLMGLSLYKDKDGQIKEQEVNFETIQALRHSIIGKAFSLTDIYYMVLNHMVTEIKVKPNALIIQQGSASTEMYIIVSGDVELLRDGGAFPNNILRPGPTGNFGELAGISNTSRNATVKAGPNGADLLQIGSQFINGLRFYNPVFNDELLHQVPGRLRPELQPYLPYWAKPTIKTIMSRSAGSSSWDMPVPVAVQDTSSDLMPENIQRILAPVLKAIEDKYPDRMGRVKKVTIVSANPNKTVPLVHIYPNPIDQTEVIVISSDLLNQKISNKAKITALRNAFDSAMTQRVAPDEVVAVTVNTAKGRRVVLSFKTLDNLLQGSDNFGMDLDGIVRLFYNASAVDKHTMVNLLSRWSKTQDKYPEIQKIVSEIIGNFPLYPTVFAPDNFILSAKILNEMLQKRYSFQQKLQEAVEHFYGPNIKPIVRENLTLLLLQWSRNKHDLSVENDVSTIIAKFAANRAMSAFATKGGIDLNTSNGMQWKISKDGKGVEMNIDPAMIAGIKEHGIDSLTPVIFRITPIASIWPLVGLKEP